MTVPEVKDIGFSHVLSGKYLRHVFRLISDLWAKLFQTSILSFFENSAIFF